MTEEEAKKKACCGPCADHRGLAMIDPLCNKIPACIGSLCMAWQWNLKLEPASEGSSIAYVVSPTDGYCGLVES